MIAVISIRAEKRERILFTRSYFFFVKKDSEYCVSVYVFAIQKEQRDKDEAVREGEIKRKALEQDGG